MSYFLVFLLSVVSSVIGFSLEIVQGNISHIKNERIPTASAAIFPTIPVIPIMYLLIAWGINLIHEDMGFIVIFTYAFISIVLRGILRQKTNTKLQSLILESRLTNPDMKDNGDKL